MKELNNFFIIVDERNMSSTINSLLSSRFFKILRTNLQLDLSYDFDNNKFVVTHLSKDFNCSIPIEYNSYYRCIKLQAQIVENLIISIVERISELKHIDMRYYRSNLRSTISLLIDDHLINDQLKLNNFLQYSLTGYPHDESLIYTLEDSFNDSLLKGHLFLDKHIYQYFKDINDDQHFITVFMFNTESYSEMIHLISYLLKMI